MAIGMNRKTHPLTAWLDSGPAWILTLVASLAAFSTYFSMYAFRKPFAAGAYVGEFSLFSRHIDLKAALVISQIIGYALSKFLGIKVCTEAGRSRRAATILGLILASEVALVAFAMVPNSWKVLAIFFNGVPLGMIWGLVVWYLEGRRTTEILLAAMSCSFIVSSGVVKSVGLWLMRDFAVSEGWMPAATGLCFLPLLLVSVWTLTRLPQANATDVAERVRRQPMTATDRLAFLVHFFTGMALLCLVYFFLTAYRDYRDNYQADILKTLGYDKQPWLLSVTETTVGFALLVVMGALYLVRDNRHALWWAFAVMIAGTVLLGTSTLLLDHKLVSGAGWMVLVGLGAYLAYVPYNTLLFERLMASTRWVGTAVFGIALADACGYVGSVVVQLYKEFADAGMNRLDFLRNYTYFMSVVGTVSLVLGWWYFARRLRVDTFGVRPVGQARPDMAEESLR